MSRNFNSLPKPVQEAIRDGNHDRLSAMSRKGNETKKKNKAILEAEISENKKLHASIHEGLVVKISPKVAAREAAQRIAEHYSLSDDGEVLPPKPQVPEQE